MQELGAKLPTGSDGTYGLLLLNNTTRTPTATSYELYPDGGAWKVNTNGTEATIATVGGALGTPSFTALNLPSSDADPSTTAGQLRHDSTITGLLYGGLKYWNGTNARLLVDLDTAPSNDDYVVSYDADADKFYMKADANSAGTPTVITVADTTGKLRNSLVALALHNRGVIP